MSRIGKKIIEVPEDVNVSIDGVDIDIEGPKGGLEILVHKDMTVKQENGSIRIERPSETPIMPLAIN